MGFIILGIALLALIGTIWYFYIRIKRFAKRNLGTDNLQEFIQTQEEMMENTPKSVSGMTSLYLPRLQADFPELNWVEFKSNGEKHLMDYLRQQSVSSPKIHQTELKDYRKNSGTCYVILQSAVEFFKVSKKTQARYNVVMSYVQDASKTGHESAYSINCPNCGAPMAQLGNKVCEYCGSNVMEVNTRIWTLDRIEEG